MLGDVIGSWDFNGAQWITNGNNEASNATVKKNGRPLGHVGVRQNIIENSDGMSTWARYDDKLEVTQARRRLATHAYSIGYTYNVMGTTVVATALV